MDKRQTLGKRRTCRQMLISSANRNWKLQTRLKKLKQENENLIRQLKLCRLRKKRQYETNIDLLKTKKVMNNQITLLNDKIKKLEQDLEEKYEKLIKITDELIESSTEQIRLQTELDSLQTELDNNKKAYDELVKEHVYNPGLKEFNENRQKQQQQSQKQLTQQNYKQNYNLIF